MIPFLVPIILTLYIFGRRFAPLQEWVQKMYKVKLCVKDFIFLSFERQEMGTGIFSQAQNSCKSIHFYKIFLSNFSVIYICKGMGEEKKGEGHMNKETIRGDWKIIQGKVREKWGKLTDDDLTEINGKRDQLLGKLQKKYGYAKEKAEEEISNWEKHLEEAKAARK